MKIVNVIDNDLNKLIPAEVKLESVVGGFKTTEGPVWDSSRNCLFFVDIPENTIYQFSGIEGIKVFRKPSYYANGLTLNMNFQLIACEHQRRAISIQREERVEILCNRYQGKKLNSPNDVIIARDGSILFSDPIYGLRDGMGGPAIRETTIQGVYRLPPGASEPILVSDDFERPNGLALNVDETKLYVDDTVRQHIRVFSIQKDWQFDGGEVFAELWGEGLGRPDGMKLDNQGNLFCTGPGGIWVFNPAGKLLGKVQMPERTTNLAWGDDDRHSLFITTTTRVYRLRCLTSGKCPTDR